MTREGENITTNEAAVQLGVSRQRVLQLIQDGRLKAEKFGNVYMIRRGDLSNIEAKPMGRPPKQADSTTQNLNQAFRKATEKSGQSTKTAPLNSPDGKVNVKKSDGAKKAAKKTAKKG